MYRLTSALLLGAGVLVTTWVSAPAAPTAPPIPVSAADLARIEELAPIADAMDQDVERLRAQLTVTPRVADPRRDPFSFGTRRPSPRIAPAIKTDVPEVVTAVEPAPILWPTLAAVMAEASGFTAVVAWGDAVEFLKSGDAFKDFQVVGVSSSRIELRHTPSGTTKTLPLR